MDDQKFITESAFQTQQLAERIAGELENRSDGKVLALYGDLGSGKTTFVQGLARALGITKRILSPTFIISRSYIVPSTSLKLYHIDLYRIGSPKEAQDLGLEEIWNDPQNICAIEWAERTEEILPKKRWEINFTDLGGDKREITITKNS